MLRVALTGGMGSGKSFVATLFEKQGVPVFYADEEVRRLYGHPKTVQFVDSLTEGQAIKPEKEGGKEVDRSTLAQLVFNDPTLKARLEAFIHPLVREAFESFCRVHATAPYVLSEAALYFETGSWKEFDAVILVTAPLELRLQRLEQKRGIPREQALQRIKNQWPDEKKIPLATWVIHNDGVHDVQAQVLQIHQALIRKAAGKGGV
ncbi:MAG: dephospho-CoA kinase [Flavobacteriales bacterium]|nr:dephospho-CoA kinase [Flavobacteriales bacterium]MCX7767913.1 dephospho-CoA kinase [Flavobacteriales bacterium]MDW8409317.1 dephospho-CoA kinase [Flavobacteriales bacterium]